MFLLYRSVNIPCCKEMMAFWDKMAKDAGFNGMHFVCTMTLQTDMIPENLSLPFKAYVEFEPGRSLDLPGYTTWEKIRVVFTPKINKILGTHFRTRSTYTFKEIAARSAKIKSQKGTYGGLFVGWDNTARKKEESLIIERPTKEEFKAHLEEKIKITQIIRVILSLIKNI